LLDSTADSSLLFIVNRTGWYNPWFFIGLAFAAIASGLFTTLEPTTNHAKWITYLVLQGIGGVAMLPSMLAIQAALASRPNQIPSGMSVLSFFQYFGASVFQSIALAVFQNQLIRGLKSRAGLNMQQIQVLLDAGTGHAKKVAAHDFPEKVVPIAWAYNRAITDVFVSLARLFSTSTASRENHSHTGRTRSADISFDSMLPSRLLCWGCSLLAALSGRTSRSLHQRSKRTRRLLSKASAKRAKKLRREIKCDWRRNMMYPLTWAFIAQAVTEHRNTKEEQAEQP
jgi:MFS family permease